MQQFLPAADQTACNTVLQFATALMLHGPVTALKFDVFGSA